MPKLSGALSGGRGSRESQTPDWKAKHHVATSSSKLLSSNHAWEGQKQGTEGRLNPEVCQNRLSLPVLGEREEEKSFQLEVKSRVLFRLN